MFNSKIIADLQLIADEEGISIFDLMTRIMKDFIKSYTKPAKPVMTEAEREAHKQNIKNIQERISKALDAIGIDYTKPDYIYTLRLEGDFYYVGWTNDIHKRLVQHMLGNATIWTGLHKPVEIVSVHKADKSYEKTRTLEIMKQYGIEKVRGGPWCMANLTENTINSIETRLTNLI